MCLQPKPPFYEQRANESDAGLCLTTTRAAIPRKRRREPIMMEYIGKCSPPEADAAYVQAARQLAPTYRSNNMLDGPNHDLDWPPSDSDDEDDNSRTPFGRDRQRQCLADLRLGWLPKHVIFRSESAGAQESIKVHFTIPGVKDRAMFALRRWLRLGGRRLIFRTSALRRKRDREMLREAAKRERLQAQKSMAHFLSGSSCSGGPVPAVATHKRFEVNIAPRLKRPRREADWARGQRADRRGRWAIASVILVRSCAPESDAWEALVDWMGHEAASWVPFNEPPG